MEIIIVITTVVVITTILIILLNKYNKKIDASSPKKVNTQNNPKLASATLDVIDSFFKD